MPAHATSTEGSIAWSPIRSLFYSCPWIWLFLKNISCLIDSRRYCDNVAHIISKNRALRNNFNARIQAYISPLPRGLSSWVEECFGILVRAGEAHSIN